MGTIAHVPIDIEESTNYFRIIVLIVDVGTETLLNLFYSLVPKHTVKGYFVSMISKIEDAKRKNIFDKSQYVKLTCPNPNPDEFDISLLIKLLNYFKLSPVKLDGLKTIRNEIVGHKCRAALTKQDFESIWVRVETILLDIARNVSGDEEQITKVKITELKEKVLDVSDREKKIIKIFEAWCKVEISSLHEKIVRNIQKIQKDVHNLRFEVKGNQPPQSKPNEEIADECEILKMLQNDLISYYRELFSSLQISPFIEVHGYASSFFDLYVKPMLTIPNRLGPQGQPWPVKTISDIFVENYKPFKKVYISSQAGCGKTSFAKYLTLIWCQAHLPVKSNDNWCTAEDVDEMRTFKLLFFVFLRDEHERECDVDIMIQNQLLYKLANNSTYTQLGLKFLQKFLSSVKFIIILDGLDEWSHRLGSECTLHNKQIPYVRARPMCTTVTTSRPWKLDVVRLRPEEIDQKFDLKCLENDFLQNLIRNVVKKLNELRGKEMQACKEMKADDFVQELKDKKLTALSKFPVVAMQLLTLWFDNAPLGKSQCEIYSNMVEFLLKRYCKKGESGSEMEEMKVDDLSRDIQTPLCLQNNMYCKVYMEHLSMLATLAYNTLFTDNEESSLVFDRETAKKYLTDEEIKMSMAVGILTQEKVIGKMSVRQSHISFLHKTFQEYLAALYVALSPGTVTHVEKKIKRVCCSIEKILEMSQLFMFLSGLCPEVMVNLHEHLRQTVSEDSRTQIYRAMCKLDPLGSSERDTLRRVQRNRGLSSEGQTLKLVQHTMEECLVECRLNGHKHVTHLPVSDFFIGWPGSQWSDVLRSLTVHNLVYSLSVAGGVAGVYSPEKIEDILNAFTVFNSIQMLWLLGVPENFVVQLVFQHKHSWRVKPKTWSHLECVTLEAMTMSGDIICSLVDSILQLPKSVIVRLDYCDIKQGTRDWKAYIRSLPQLTVDYDDDLGRIVKLLQFHPNTV